MTSVKKLMKYSQTGKKFEKANPTVAYYCNLYMVKQCVTIQNKTTEDNKVLMGLMDYLEQRKGSAASEEEGKAQVEHAAIQMFLAANQADSKGSSSWKKTAMTYRTAFCLMDVAKQFGEWDDEMARKYKHATNRCIVILKELKQSIPPTPTTYQQEEEEDAMDETPDFEDFHAPPSHSTALPSAQHSTALPSAQQYNPPAPEQPPYYAPAPTPAPAPNAHSFHGNYDPYSYAPEAAPSAYAPPVNPSYANANLTGHGPGISSVVHIQGDRSLATDKLDAILKGEKMIREALASLRFDDLPTVCDKIQEAMAVMHPWKDDELHH